MGSFHHNGLRTLKWSIPMQARKRISVDTDDFLTGGGQVALRIREHDWDATPLGPIEGWPLALRYTLSSMLNSAFPMYLAWGSSLVSFYNDAYRPILGVKPEALGRPFPEVWSEAWDQIGPVTDRALHGEASYLEDYTVTVNRHGVREKSHWTFAYSPVRDDGGQVQGVLCHVHETTERVSTEERFRSALREIEAQQARFAALIEHLPFGAGLFGADGQAVLTNPLCRRFLPAARLPPSVPSCGRNGLVSTPMAGSSNRMNTRLRGRSGARSFRARASCTGPPRGMPVGCASARFRC